MKKSLIVAAAASLLLFGGQTNLEAATVDNLDTSKAQMQETNQPLPFHDRYIIGHESGRDRHRHREWERRHHDDYRRHHRDRYYNGYGAPPPPPRR